MSRVDSDNYDKAESNYKGIEDSENLFEDWLKSSPNPSPQRASSIQTIIVKSVAQSYQDMFKNIYIEGGDYDCHSSIRGIEKFNGSNACHSSIRGIEKFNGSNAPSTSMSYASPKQNTGSVIEIKELSRTFYGSIVEQAQESGEDEEILLGYCEVCMKNTYPVVGVRLKEMSFWGSIRYFIDSFSCCAAGGEMKEYHESVYVCPVCKKEIALKKIINK
ncbi:hypothetical protein SteCoe_26149 [Stentor coeruleus]|uniref:LITAF domain-containing protein n=1 Tax=Stentor coeruleus TaxID=5963 RepID=A0A1R2BE03_9CILI|nr:hypothetical protein SteCoe_26149 [Stentor coeruleus]